MTSLGLGNGTIMLRKTIHGKIKLFKKKLKFSHCRKKPYEFVLAGSCQI